MATAAEILQTLDRCCQDATFPALDNGYLYLAATRLSLFRSNADWAMVFEVFGFSPRAGAPDLAVSTFASTPSACESRAFFPLDDGWQDEDDLEIVSAAPGVKAVLRGREHPLPALAEYAGHGIELVDPPTIHVYEYCRYIAAVAREGVLATSSERRVDVLQEMEQLLVLDDWEHPDVVAGQRPSHAKSFQQLARVLETGDVGLYRPTKPGNTHWKHWPEGGTL